MAVDTRWSTGVGFGGPLPPMSDISKEDFEAHTAEDSNYIQQTGESNASTQEHQGVMDTINTKYQQDNAPATTNMSPTVTKASIADPGAPTYGEAAALGTTARATTDITGAGPLDPSSTMRAGGDYNLASGTVAGQMEALYNTENPYMKNAMLGSQEQAAGRGMLNTSLAAGAGQRAAIDAGFQIASQDAQTAAGFQERQQAGDIEGVLQRDASKYGLEDIREQGKVQGELAGEKFGYGIGDLAAKEGSSSRESMQSFAQDAAKSTQDWQQELGTMGVAEGYRGAAAEQLHGFATQLQGYSQDWQAAMTERGYDEGRIIRGAELFAELGKEFMNNAMDGYRSGDVTPAEMEENFNNGATILSTLGSINGFPKFNFSLTRR